jgi:signal transduction histidine kinase
MTGGDATGISEPRFRGAHESAQEDDALRLLLAEQYRLHAQERQWIVRELRDELQQTLVAVILRLSAVERTLAPGCAEATAGLREAKGLVEQAIGTTRGIVEDLTGGSRRATGGVILSCRQPR